MLLNRLLKLYKTHSTKTPLEDFTTEAFVGVLNLDKELKESFIKDFLKLPNDNYILDTQVRYPLENDIDCIIDIVLQGDNTICFIENKVDSTEGYRQLERYSLVLDQFKKEGKQTKLVYCTKNYDPKEEQKYKHNFLYTRWHKIADFIKQQNRDTQLPFEFLNFLNKNKMSQDLTLTALDYITANNLISTISKFNDYIDRVEPIFLRYFTIENNKNKSVNLSVNKLIEHHRIIYIASNIIESQKYSDIKYGFLLGEETVLAYTGIWVDKNNPGYDRFLKIINLLKENQLYSIDTISAGSYIELKKDLSIFLNNEKAEQELKDWYEGSFKLLADFIKASPEMKWKIKVK